MRFGDYNSSLKPALEALEIERLWLKMNIRCLNQYLILNTTCLIENTIT